MQPIQKSRFQQAMEWIKSIQWMVMANTYHNWILGLSKDKQVEPKFKVYTWSIVIFSPIIILWTSKNLSGEYFADSFVGNIVTFGLCTIAFRIIAQALPWIGFGLLWLYNKCPNFSRIMLMTARIDETTLARHSSERRKYISLGIAMWIGPIISFVSGTVLGCDIFHLETPVLMGLFWAIVVLMVEIVLVGTMKRDKDGNYSKTTLSLRIFFAVVLAVVESTPVDLRIFRAEIDEKLKTEYIVEGVRLDSLCKKEIALIDTSEAQEKRLIENDMYILYKEMETGYKDKSRIKEGNWKDRQSKFDNVTKPELEKKRTEIRASYKAKLSEYKETQAQGLGGRLEALKRTKDDKPVIFICALMIMLFSVSLGTIAVIAKFFLPETAYDRDMKGQEEESNRKIETRRQQALLIQNTALETTKIQEVTKIQVATENENGKVEAARVIAQGTVDAATQTAAAIVEVARLDATHKKNVAQQLATLRASDIQSDAENLRHLEKIEGLEAKMRVVAEKIASLSADEKVRLEIGLTSLLKKLQEQFEALTSQSLTTQTI